MINSIDLWAEAHDVLTVPHSRSAYDEKLRLIRERLGRAERHPPVVPYANCRFPAAGPHPAAAGNIIPTRRVMVPPHVRQMMACTTLPVVRPVPLAHFIADMQQLAPRYRYIAVIRTPRGRLIATLGLYGIVWSYLPEV